MTEPKISIIVPVYNAEKYLQRCIDSLTNQTLKEIEIILVDDASPDNCPAICDEAALKDSRICVVHKENEGAGLSRNAGLKIAKGKYVGFVDSDDYADLEMYEILYKTAEKYNSDLVMSGVWHVGGIMFKNEGDRTSKLYFDKDTHFTTKEELKNLKLGIVGALPHEYEDSKYGMSVWKNLFKRDIIEKNGLTFCSEREMLSEDSLFMIDYIQCINKATGIRDALYNYCRNEDSISKSYEKERINKSMVFITQAEKRFKKDIPQDEYMLYLNRFTQAFCRVLCSQEIMYSSQNNIKYFELKKRLKEICTHPKMCEALKRYPWRKLPVKQAVFAFAMKYRLYLLQKILVSLRNR